jgi:Flp pilus assembly protein TadG
MRLQRAKRPGATLVESAVVSPVVFLLLLGLLVGAAGIFRYQEMASLTRRASRYASVHGTQCAKDTNVPAATPADVFNNVVLPNAVILDPSRLTCSVRYSGSNTPYQASVVNGQVVTTPAWPSASPPSTPYSTSTVNGKVVATANTVSVTLSYQWIPEVFLGGITLTSTSVMPMCY